MEKCNCGNNLKTENITKPWYKDFIENSPLECEECYCGKHTCYLCAKDGTPVILKTGDIKKSRCGYCNVLYLCEKHQNYEKNLRSCVHCKRYF